MEDKKNVGVFETLSKVNVNDKTEKKGKFTYLSWSFAWSELMSVLRFIMMKIQICLISHQKQVLWLRLA